MNNMGVMIPLMCAGVGFAMGGLIGFGLDALRRKELAADVKDALSGAHALIDTCRELLDATMFERVRTRSMERLGLKGVA